MKERELIVYKDFEDGDLLNDMVYLMDNYKDEKADTDSLKSMFYSCFHKLLELAGHFGFYGNLWHILLAPVRACRDCICRLRSTKLLR